jgi:hypothetical protein
MLLDLKGAGMSDADHQAYWTLAEVFAWAQAQDPPILIHQFLLTLHELCRSGRVRTVGRRCEGVTAPLGGPRSGRPLESSDPISPLQWANLYFDSDGQQFRSEDLFSGVLRRQRVWTSVRFSRDHLIGEWPRAGAAAFVEAQADQYWTERDRERAKRSMRSRATERRKRSLRRDGKWASVGEVADWLAREGQRLGERLGARAYEEFWRALQDGEFDRDGKTRALLLNPATTWARVTTNRGRWALETHGWDTFVSQFLSCSWVEIDRALRWLAGWLPRDLSQRWAATQAHSVPLCPSHAYFANPRSREAIATSTKAPPVPDRELRKWYRERVADLVKRCGRSSAESDWIAARDHFPGRVTRMRIRAIRGELGPEAWRKQGRRPAGSSKVMAARTAGTPTARC